MPTPVSCFRFRCQFFLDNSNKPPNANSFELLADRVSSRAAQYLCDNEQFFAPDFSLLNQRLNGFADCIFISVYLSRVDQAISGLNGGPYGDVRLFGFHLKVELSVIIGWIIRLYSKFFFDSREFCLQALTLYGNCGVTAFQTRKEQVEQKSKGGEGLKSGGKETEVRNTEANMASLITHCPSFPKLIVCNKRMESYCLCKKPF